MLKYDYSNFTLDVLQYCGLSLLLSREQYYINNLSLEYNIIKIAGSRYGAELSNRTRKLMSEASKKQVHFPKIEREKYNSCDKQTRCGYLFLR